MTDKTYTRDQVSAAVNAGADLVTSDPDVYLDGRTYDLVNLIVNAQLSLLDNPDVSLNDVILANYQPEVVDVDDEEEVELIDGHDREQSQAIHTVRGWVS